MLRIIQEVHQHGVLHNDIKPENICLGTTEETSNQLFLVDFGIAKNFLVKGEHIPNKKRTQFAGTARYASVNSHFGREVSRRDDLESIGYVLLYLLTGDLPWIKIPTTSEEEKIILVGKSKQETPLDVLCKDAPEAFYHFMRYYRNLEFT